MVSRALTLLLLLVSACATAARQEDTRRLTPAEPGGRVVELSNVVGKFPEIESVSLYFYQGEFEIPLHREPNGRYRGNVGKDQVNGMVRQKYGFRVYRCRLTIVSRAGSGERDTKTQDLTIALEPGPAA